MAIGVEGMTNEAEEGSYVTSWLRVSMACIAPHTVAQVMFPPLASVTCSSKDSSTPSASGTSASSTETEIVNAVGAGEALEGSDDEMEL